VWFGQVQYHASRGGQAQMKRFILTVILVLSLSLPVLADQPVMAILDGQARSQINCYLSSLGHDWCILAGCVLSTRDSYRRGDYVFKLLCRSDMRLMDVYVGVYKGRVAQISTLPIRAGKNFGIGL
jgi:hypothetical protein